MRKELAGWLFVAAISAPPAAAQSGGTPAAASPQSAPRQFDVASIRVNKGGADSAHWGWGDDHFNAENITLPWFLQVAYDLKPYQISGVPKALEDVHFDIQAKVLPDDPDKPVKLSDKELKAMLIPLLEQRFKLKAHMETKTGSIYDLVVAKGGPKLGPVTMDAVNGNWSARWSGHTLQLTATKITVAALADYLSDPVDHPVIDKTGLAGRYDFTLKWAAEDSAGSETPDAGPSIFTAVEEQLGLKLVPAKGPVKTLVVDHVEMPSEN